jgi:UDP-3-O-[3-hydroxymyristoyl] N-acetylglucosamine deacetylase
MSSTAVELVGVGLHTGADVVVRVVGASGPITLVQGDFETPIHDCAIVRTDRGVTLSAQNGQVRVELVEHFLAALGGLGIRADVRVVVAGPEFPLLDGGARRFADALLSVGARTSRPPTLRVARESR